ncbi:uncharacterized protein [Panulirus ornatus]|uniref:uncharacterized protein n=1 Tax=Panulirus ornatus TaxID=150431 RepID=UPI003A83F22C
MSDEESQVEEASLNSLQRSLILQELVPGGGTQDPTEEHGSRRLFVRVEGAPRASSQTPTTVALQGGQRHPFPRPRAPTPESGPDKTKTRPRRRGFSLFGLWRSGRREVTKGSQEKGNFLPGSRKSNLPEVEDDEANLIHPTRLFRPASTPDPSTQGDRGGWQTLGPGPGLVPRRLHDNTQDLEDLSPIYCILNASEKGVGDFTSITFEIEELTEVDERHENGPGNLSHPKSQGHSLKKQLLRPHTQDGRPPTADGKVLLTTPILRPAHLLPPLAESRSPVRGAFRAQDLESWMSNLPPALQRIPLNHLFIPGSHDSFSYSLVAGEEVGPDAPGFVSRLAACCPCLARRAILRWSVTQRACATDQLRHGIRYFDIRVAVRGSRFYFVHGLYGGDLQPLLSEVGHFLSKHPGEVVLLDFQHFHGLSPADHTALVGLLRTTFSNAICPFFHQLRHLSLAYLARCNYQVLVFYRHTETMRAVSWLWSGDSLPNPWPDATSVPQMLDFLSDRLDIRDPKTFFVTQCVLTPSGNYLAKNLCGKLERSLAAPTNRVLPGWVEGLPAGPPGANVIMTDFVDHEDWAVPRAVVTKNFVSLLQKTNLTTH